MVLPTSSSCLALMSASDSSSKTSTLLLLHVDLVEAGGDGGISRQLMSRL
jgi:hypothetical protein